MNPITFELNDEKEITKISTVPTALIASIITTILVILLCAITIFIAPIIISAIVQTLMFSGQTVMAFALYQRIHGAHLYLAPQPRLDQDTSSPKK